MRVLLPGGAGYIGSHEGASRRWFISLGSSLLGCRARRTLEDACRDAWRWQSHNPRGHLVG